MLDREEQDEGGAERRIRREKNLRRTYETKDLEIFNLLRVPVWIFDFKKRQMLWCNLEGLELWSADTLEELLARDWAGDMSQAIQMQCDHFAYTLSQGGSIKELFTFYPLPTRQPRTTLMTLTGIQLKDRSQEGEGPRSGTALVMAEYVGESLSHQEIRAVAAMRHTIAMNPAAVNNYYPGSQKQGEPPQEDPIKVSPSGSLLAGNRLLQRFAKPEDWEDCRNTLDQGSVWEKETPMMGCHGPKWHSVTVKRIKDPISGESAFLVSEMDITAKKKLEKENSDKDTFLGMVSHEIRTPINGILGFNSLLLETSLTEEQRDFTTSIQRSAKLLLAHVNDLLDFAKIAEGKLRMETALVSLEEVVETVTKLARPLAEEKQLELRCTVDKIIPRVLFGDPLRISQIIQNFLSNAVKFTSKGYIHVKVTVNKDPACAIPSDGKERGDESYLAGMDDNNSIFLKISVQDTGIGVPPDMRKAIFGKFVQADSSISRRFGGTGLGLAICKRVARMMGGDCSCRSPAIPPFEREDVGGPGSEFWATLRVRTTFEAKQPSKFFLVHPQLTPHLYALHVPPMQPLAAVSTQSEPLIDSAALRGLDPVQRRLSVPELAPELTADPRAGYTPLRDDILSALTENEDMAYLDNDQLPPLPRQRQQPQRQRRIKLRLPARSVSCCGDGGGSSDEEQAGMKSPLSPLGASSVTGQRKPVNSSSSPLPPSSSAKRDSFSQESVGQNYDMLCEVLAQCTNVEVERVETLEQLEAARREISRGVTLTTATAPNDANPAVSLGEPTSGGSLLDVDEDNADDAGKTPATGATAVTRPRAVVVVCLVEIPGLANRSNPRSFRRFLSSYFSRAATATAASSLMEASGDETATAGGMRHFDFDRADAQALNGGGSHTTKHRADVWLITGVSETVNCFLNSCVFKYAGPTQSGGRFPSYREAAPRRRAASPRPRSSSADHSAASVSTTKNGFATERQPSEIVVTTPPTMIPVTASGGQSSPREASGWKTRKASLSLPHLRLGSAADSHHQAEGDGEEEPTTRLALATTREKRAASDDASVESPHKRRVLVVEDNAMNQKLIRNILVREGYDVEVAGDGLEALDVIREKGLDHFSLVLMDIQMPKMNGYECTQAIRALPDPTARTIPIVGVSATSGEDVVERCLSKGMNATIAKPYSLQTIRSHLNQYAPRYVTPSPRAARLASL
ncbi:His Kinase A (phosphoacceptor) domain containing protein [Acanthamoeba castellanii str. Neff]|uniref:His Kinase A (Phosphoacceptor) domain containing protein n=1 Tax=Acanthamoeba castellanii (strain ATCC 30010 / Neff) TaxID=1257118 RepID=L8HKZ2_ACACF|nr:His Kinase A (phosphoacceptor) domain containing protein [Acanthamoeba castellanii str. Neff]ELR25046.1 His Kinase A (phosphoacceptor) domain containing protein [Acanthamoeba castellanii str. Neff]